MTKLTRIDQINKLSEADHIFHVEENGFVDYGIVEISEYSIKLLHHDGTIKTKICALTQLIEEEWYLPF